MEMEKLMQSVMAEKKLIGEFSLDMYWDDLAMRGEECVARLSFPDGKVEHFRDKKFTYTILKASMRITDIAKERFNESRID